MSVWTSTVMMKPPKVDCDSASANTRLVSASALGAAVLARVHQAEQAGVAELSQHLARRHAGVFPGERVRLDLARDEARDLLAQQLVLGREVDALHRGATSRSARTASPRSSRARADRRRAGAPRSASGTRRAAAAATAVPASIACAWPRWCTWWLSRWAMTWPRRSRWIRPSPRSISTTSSSAAASSAVDVVDEALVGGRLRRGQRRERHAASAPRRQLPLHVGLAVQRREVVEVDREDVLERLRQAREEAGPRRLVVLARERAHRRVQAMVGEPVGVRPGCAGRRAAPSGRCAPVRTAALEPALDLRAPVVAPERLAVDDEERRAEDAARDRRVVRRLQPRLPARRRSRRASACVARRGRTRRASAFSARRVATGRRRA